MENRDRMIYARPLDHTLQIELVRYDIAGRYYLEHTDGSGKRQQLTVKEAARVAVGQNLRVTDSGRYNRRFMSEIDRARFSS